MKTKFQTLKSWAIVAFVVSGIGAGLIMATSYLTDHGDALPPWF